MDDPQAIQKLVSKIHNTACDCKEIINNTPLTGTYSLQQSCGEKVAYLLHGHVSEVGKNQRWVCLKLPNLASPINGVLPKCACTQIYSSLQTQCYTAYSQCINESNNKTYYFTKLSRTDLMFKPPERISNSKLQLSNCGGNDAAIGKEVCWSPTPPIHMSDGGGPQDQARELVAKKQLQAIIDHLYPQLHYHPLAKIKIQNIDLDPQTYDILTATWRLLNMSKPELASDCWLCLRMGGPLPLALPPRNNTYSNFSSSCSISIPFRVLIEFENSTLCFSLPSTNDSNEIDLGVLPIDCQETITSSNPLCPTNGTVFICGGSLAYTALPQNWTGLCVLNILLPNIDIIRGEEPVPIPRLDLIAGRQKRAVQMLPLLATMGILGALGTGSAGIGVSVTQYTKLSKQLIGEVQALSSTIQDVQDQLDSLAEVVLQNRRGLDLLTVEKGGICLALQERCCFYTNKSGIVRDKIKKLQEELEKRRQELAESPLWSAFNGLLPYLLPILGPLITLLLIISIAPAVIRKILQLVKDQVNSALGRPIQVHYQRLHLQDQGVTLEGQENIYPL
ncbi:syncytin-1 [Tamandua tetradactyla]|uniref:syncytin-1 n=1 Tax=Tamandua tetradactyla TaxID=48850 RepID=UPI00405467CE